MIIHVLTRSPRIAMNEVAVDGAINPSNPVFKYVTDIDGLRGYPRGSLVLDLFWHGSNIHTQQDRATYAEFMQHCKIRQFNLINILALRLLIEDRI